MAHILKPRVAENSTSTGTGAFALASALTGHQRFNAVCATNDTVEYVIAAADGSWEEGIGTYSSANTLTRTTVTNSSNAGAAVNFAAGDKVVMLTPSASRLGTAPRGGSAGQWLAKLSGTDFDGVWTNTLTNPVIDGGITEEPYTVTDGASIALSPTNGTLQTLTLGASRTLAAPGTWANGQSMTLMIADGTAYTITWTSVLGSAQWVGGVAPTLAATGYTVVELWKAGGVIYGSHVGDVA